MSEIGDWVWLIIGGLWVLFRVLPRLFRSSARKGTPAPRPRRPTPSEPMSRTEPGTDRDYKPLEPR